MTLPSSFLLQLLKCLVYPRVVLSVRHTADHGVLVVLVIVAMVLVSS